MRRSMEACRPLRLPGSLTRLLAAAFLSAAAGCYTEVGNPTKENQVTATFSIDYSAEAALKAAASSADGSGPAAGALAAGTGVMSIEQFWFNVVEANYNTDEEEDNRIWKVPDSLGTRVDFTGRDSQAALPPVSVPAAVWNFMKLESRIPDHDTLRLDSLDFASFSNPGYIKGVYAAGGRTRRFLCQLPHVYRINLLYEKALLETLKHGDTYALEFTFYARRWAGDADFLAADTVVDRSGLAVAVVDVEHNQELYDQLTKNFYKAFNSSKVWKEEFDD